MLTFENFFFFSLGKGKEFLYTFEEILLQFGWNTVPCDLEETVVQTALSDLFNQVRFGNLIVAIKRLIRISEHVHKLDLQGSHQKSPGSGELVRWS